MPEAAVDENCPAPSSVGDIGAAGKILITQRVPMPKPVEQLTDQLFRTSTLLPNSTQAAGGLLIDLDLPLPDAGVGGFPLRGQV